ncbi:hypothetical protein ANOM_007896 [Aspergillus nomiae NRRL 13137]|uniref:Nitrogen regulatory protein areA GATA-like domain-containing protein n=1 Tax=Aspergillus nomiae NRRL (strain ATCC 15546 / NRRL 13137 / CBS 260.88 / M93) TaxID=1509407 RepID=A0A0L1IZJ5_ASPN3|nr:uncharacterized protein ANOM_007896 [Aspergillus nomiae NRRL 13137]KNG84583.1 hypothetical protein ANOM_007896 [Aspergillus nomiae NRRL 13137]
MESLPKGLVSTTRKVPSELDDRNIVDTSDVRRLWKVYNTHPSVHEGDIGYRLENFFWRIWSSDRLCGSLDGSTLAKLFQQISESNPVSSFALQQLKKERASPAGRGSDDKLQGTPGNSARRAPLQPILKKSSAPSGDTHKTTRLLLTGLEGQSITRKPSNPPTPVPQSQPLVGDFDRPVPKPKTVFVKGKNTKRRPVIMRRKSSQTSSGASTRTQSPQRTAKLLTLGARTTPSKQEESSDSEAEAVHIEHVVPREKSSDTTDKPPELPPEFLRNLKEILTNKGPDPQSTQPTPPKWGFVTTDDWTHYDVRYLSAENYEQPSSESLVDKGFRSRFTEQVGLEKEYLAKSVGASSKDGLLQFLQSRSFEFKASDASHAQSDSTVDTPTTSAGIPIPTPNTDSSTTFSTNSLGRATFGGFPTLLTPFSLTRGRSSLVCSLKSTGKSNRQEVIQWAVTNSSDIMRTPG